MESCSLDREGMRRQRGRHRRVAGDVREVLVEESSLTIRLAPGFDRAAWDEMLAVERSCCPFFDFDVDYRGHRIRVSVAEPRQRPALGALAEALEP